MQGRNGDMYNRLSYTYLIAMCAHKHVHVAKTLPSSICNVIRNLIWAAVAMIVGTLWRYHDEQFPQVVGYRPISIPVHFCVQSLRNAYLWCRLIVCCVSRSLVVCSGVLLRLVEIFVENCIVFFKKLFDAVPTQALPCRACTEEAPS